LGDPPCRRAIADLARVLRDAFDCDASAAGPVSAALPHGSALAGPAARRPTPTRVVDPTGGGDFTTLADAVAAARPGDRVLVRPGSYDGPIKIDTPLEVVGEGPADEIVVMAEKGGVLVVTASHGSVRGLTLRATGEPREASVVDVRAGRLVLDGCDISGGATGVTIRAYAEPHIRRCRIHHTSGHGIRVLGAGAGVFEDNEITGSGRSNISVTSGGNPTVRGNRITASEHSGVWVGDDGRGVFEDNDIAGNSWSNVSVGSGGRPTVRGNRITASEHEGVHVWNNGAGLFEDNDIAGNTLSNVAVESGGNPTFRNNRITGSQQQGVHVYGDGAGVFEGNTVMDNRGQDWDVSGADGARLVRR
jgi:F-box protein 11